MNGVNSDSRRKQAVIMESLAKLINDNEEWLMQRILQYAWDRNYVKYTSTLAEA